MTNKLWTSLVFYCFISFILLFIHFSDEEVSRKATITTTISIDCVTKVTWMEFNKTKVNSTATWKSTKKPSKNVTPSDGSKAKIAFSPFLKKGKSQWRLIHQNLVRTIWKKGIWRFMLGINSMMRTISFAFCSFLFSLVLFSAQFSHKTLWRISVPSLQLIVAAKTCNQRYTS